MALNQPTQPQRIVGFLKSAMLDPMPVAALAPGRTNLKMSNALMELARTGGGGRGGAISQADALRVFANSPLRYAEGDAVGDLILGGSDQVRRSFIRRARRRICEGRPGEPVIVDADILDPVLGIAGSDGVVHCRPETP